MRPGTLPRRDARGDLAPRAPWYANEAIHRASNGLGGGACLSEGGWERVIPAVSDRPGRLKHNKNAKFVGYEPAIGMPVASVNCANECKISRVARQQEKHDNFYQKTLFKII